MGFKFNRKAISDFFSPKEERYLFGLYKEAGTHALYSKQLAAAAEALENRSVIEIPREYPNYQNKSFGVQKLFHYDDSTITCTCIGRHSNKKRSKNSASLSAGIEYRIQLPKNIFREKIIVKTDMQQNTSIKIFKATAIGVFVSGITMWVSDNLHLSFTVFLLSTWSMYMYIQYQTIKNMQTIENQWFEKYFDVLCYDEIYMRQVFNPLFIENITRWLHEFKITKGNRHGINIIFDEDLVIISRRLSTSRRVYNNNFTSPSLRHLFGFDINNNASKNIQHELQHIISIVDDLNIMSLDKIEEQPQKIIMA